MTETNDPGVSDVDRIVGDLPMESLAARLGVDPGTAESAVRQALPALLGGMRANAADPSGAASLSGAIEQHSPNLIDGGVDLDDVDTADGEKIVDHVFGANSQGVVQTLGQNIGGGGGGGGGELIQKLLPILAPIVLSYLAQRMRGGSGHTTGVEDLLGSILGGLGGPGGSGGGQQAGGGIMDLLGGLLGGGRR